MSHRQDADATFNRLQDGAVAVKPMMDWVRKFTGALGLNHSPRIRKIVVSVIGGTIVLFGIALLVLPGPGSLVIPLGLVILASEFAWARHVLRRGKTAVEKARRGKWREAFSFSREQ